MRPKRNSRFLSSFLLRHHRQIEADFQPTLSLFVGRKELTVRNLLMVIQTHLFYPTNKCVLKRD